MRLYKAVYEILSEIKEPYREVLYLRYFSDYSCKEIAARTGKALNTITKMLSRGHALIAQELRQLQGHTTVLGFWLHNEKGNKND
jgi:DNA-directed RNA polymerase specialized sigma24 family protein